MGNRRFAQIDTSDEDDELVLSRLSRSSHNAEEKRKRKRMKLGEEDEEEEEKQNQDKRKETEDSEDDVEKEKKSSRDKKAKSKAVEESEPEEEVEEEAQEDAKPIGDVIRVSGKGRGRRNHYKSFEYDGLSYDLVSISFFKCVINLFKLKNAYVFALGL